MSRNSIAHKRDVLAPHGEATKPVWQFALSATACYFAVFSGLSFGLWFLHQNDYVGVALRYADTVVLLMAIPYFQATLTTRLAVCGLLALLWFLPSFLVPHIGLGIRDISGRPVRDSFERAVILAAVSVLMINVIWLLYRNKAPIKAAWYGLWYD